MLRNTGALPLKFTHLKIEALGLSLGPENETILSAQYGTVPREIFYTGRSEDACLLLANSRTGVGVAILSEVPGYMKRIEIGGWDDPERARLGVLYDTDLMPFERFVAVAEEFKTASVSLATFRHGDSFHDPRWVLPSYTGKIGNIHAELPTIQESFATAIGSAPLLLGDLRKLSADDRQWYREKIGWFKKLRRQTKISESFFPLGSHIQTSSDKWDGFARLARIGDGVIVLFRNKSQVLSATVQITVMAAGKFKLHSVITGKNIGIFRKDDFARGTPILLTEQVEVLEVSAIG